MGHQFQYSTAGDVTKEILENYSTLGQIDYDRLEREGNRWDLKDLSLKDKFTRIDYQPIPGDEKYPMVLMTGNTLHHSGSLTQKCEEINVIEREGFCQINPEDAKELDIKSGDWVAVESPSGKIEIKAKINDEIQKGTIFIPLNFEEIEVNLLMNKDKAVDRVRIRKVESEE